MKLILLATKYAAKRSPLRVFLAGVLTTTLMLSLPLEAFAASTPTLVRTTTLGHYHPGLRGLAYDGHYYYIADCNDHEIDGRPDDLTGRIYVYDDKGGFVKRFPKSHPSAGASSGMAPPLMARSSGRRITGADIFTSMRL